MNIEDKISYWTDIAEYDFETARAMLNSRRYLYVGFMCHQVMEKLLKAYYWLILNDEPPFIHNLLQLSKKSEIFDIMPDQYKELINIISPLNIQTRYPGDKERLLDTLDDKFCTEIFSQTEEFKLWIIQLLKK